MGNVRSDPLRMPPMLVRGSPNLVCLNAPCACCRYMTARLLGDKDLHIIRAYDKRPPAVQEEQLDDVCLPPPFPRGTSMSPRASLSATSRMRGSCRYGASVGLGGHCNGCQRR